MKLKRIPEDFEVSERTSVTPLAAGPFGLYRLTKRGLGTPEAVDTVLRAWRLPRSAVSFGGLKDRHALTRQHLTIQGGPPRDLDQGAVRLEHLGRLDRPFTAQDLAGNAFRVVLRALSGPEEQAALAALPALAEDGVPNYFDDQRFGSLGRGGAWIGRAWALEDYERALFLAVAESNEHDRPRDRAAKEALRAGWGRWEGLAARLAPHPLARLAQHLAAHPADHRGALAAQRSDLRSLWIAAYQSHLWNRLLARVVLAEVPAAERVTLALKEGPAVFWRRLDPPARARLEGLVLPLPSARSEAPPGPVGEHLAAVLAEEGVRLEDLVIRFPRGSFFSKGERAALLRPEGLTHAAADDDLHPGRRRLTLAFALPKGAYATMLVKRLTAVALAPPA